jgi:hypothetical protein
MTATIQKQFATGRPSEENISSSKDTLLEVFNSYENRLQDFIKNQISKVTEVEFIFCRSEEQAYFVWTIINKLDPNVRKTIYEYQKFIVQSFPEQMFDFYIVARTDDPIDSIVGEKGMELIFSKQ